MTVEQARWSDRSLLVVDFHEVTHHGIRGFDGRPVERTADLHNRNWWRVDGERLTTTAGAEFVGHRTIGGREPTDEIDPWGLSAWHVFRPPRRADATRLVLGVSGGLRKKLASASARWAAWEGSGGGPSTVSRAGHAVGKTAQTDLP